MAEKIKLVQGDTKPIIVVSLTDETSGSPLDVSAATTRLKFRAAGSTTLLATLTGSNIAGKLNDDGTINALAPYNVAGAGGRCQFFWGPNDLNQPAGDYEGEIEITYSDGSVQTVYDLVKFKIREDF